MLNDKKKIIYIVAAVVLVAVIATGTVLVLKSLDNGKSNTNQTQTPAPTAKEATDAQMNEAVQSLHSDPAKAKELLLQLRKKYEDQGDTNGVINVDAQLFLINNPKTTK